MSLTQQQQFIRNEALGSSIRAAFPPYQKFYRVDATKKEKELFRSKTRAVLVELGGLYSVHVSVDSHISNITTLQRFLNKQSALKPNSITFGVAQKMLNLYLKYEWCLGIIPETPHCPVDNAVLHEAGVKSKVRWSKMQQEDYSTAISQIEENVFPLRANEWELRMFNDKNRAYGVSVEKSGLAFRE